MNYRIITSSFTSPILISLIQDTDIDVEDCYFSNCAASDVALNLTTGGRCSLQRCCFYDITFQSVVGYLIKSKSADCGDITMFNLSLSKSSREGGGVQNIETKKSSLKSSNVTNVKTTHICIASIERTGIALTSFLNAYNLSAEILGVGIQFNYIEEFASLQFSNFIKVSSPIYGIVRAVHSYPNVTVYAAFCFFSDMIDGQKAFYGDSPIQVSSSTNMKTEQPNVTYVDSNEVSGPLEIDVQTRNPRWPSCWDLMWKYPLFSLLSPFFLKINF